MIGVDYYSLRTTTFIFTFLLIFQTLLSFLILKRTNWRPWRIYDWIYARKWPRVMQTGQLELFVIFLFVVSWIIILSPSIVLLFWTISLLNQIQRTEISLSVFLLGTFVFLFIISFIFWKKTFSRNQRFISVPLSFSLLFLFVFEFFSVYFISKRKDSHEKISNNFFFGCAFISISIDMIFFSTIVFQYEGIDIEIFITQLYDRITKNGNFYHSKISINSIPKFTYIKSKMKWKLLLYLLSSISLFFISLLFSIFSYQKKYLLFFTSVVIIFSDLILFSFANCFETYMKKIFFIFFSFLIKIVLVPFGINYWFIGHCISYTLLSSFCLFFSLHSLFKNKKIKSEKNLQKMLTDTVNLLQSVPSNVIVSKSNVMSNNFRSIVSRKHYELKSNSLPLYKSKSIISQEHYEPKSVLSQEHYEPKLTIHPPKETNSIISQKHYGASSSAIMENDVKLKGKMVNDNVDGSYAYNDDDDDCEDDVDGNHYHDLNEFMKNKNQQSEEKLQQLMRFMNEDGYNDDDDDDGDGDDVIYDNKVHGERVGDKKYNGYDVNNDVNFDEYENDNDYESRMEDAFKRMYDDDIDYNLNNNENIYKNNGENEYYYDEEMENNMIQNGYGHNFEQTSFLFQKNNHANSYYVLVEDDDDDDNDDDDDDDNDDDDDGEEDNDGDDHYNHHHDNHDNNHHNDFDDEDAMMYERMKMEFMNNNNNNNSNNIINGNANEMIYMENQNQSQNQYPYQNNNEIQSEKSSFASNNNDINIKNNINNNNNMINLNNNNKKNNNNISNNTFTDPNLYLHMRQKGIKLSENENNMKNEKKKRRKKGKMIKETNNGLLQFRKILKNKYFPVFCYSILSFFFLLEIIIVLIFHQKNTSFVNNKVNQFWFGFISLFIPPIISISFIYFFYLKKYKNSTSWRLLMIGFVFCLSICCLGLILSFLSKSTILLSLSISFPLIFFSFFLSFPILCENNFHLFVNEKKMKRKMDDNDYSINNDNENMNVDNHSNNNNSNNNNSNNNSNNNNSNNNNDNNNVSVSKESSSGKFLIINNFSIQNFRAIIAIILFFFGNILLIIMINKNVYDDLRKNDEKNSNFSKKYYFYTTSEYISILLPSLILLFFSFFFSFFSYFENDFVSFSSMLSLIIFGVTLFGYSLSCFLKSISIKNESKRDLKFDIMILLIHLLFFPSIFCILFGLYKWKDDQYKMNKISLSFLSLGNTLLFMLFIVIMILFQPFIVGFSLFSSLLFFIFFIFHFSKWFSNNYFLSFSENIFFNFIYILLSIITIVISKHEGYFFLGFSICFILINLFYFFLSNLVIFSSKNIVLSPKLFPSFIYDFNIDKTKDISSYFLLFNTNCILIIIWTNILLLYSRNIICCLFVENIFFFFLFVFNSSFQIRTSELISNSLQKITKILILESVIYAISKAKHYFSGTYISLAKFSTDFSELINDKSLKIEKSGQVSVPPGNMSQIRKQLAQEISVAKKTSLLKTERHLARNESAENSERNFEQNLELNVSDSTKKNFLHTKKVEAHAKILALEESYDAIWENIYKHFASYLFFMIYFSAQNQKIQDELVLKQFLDKNGYSNISKKIKSWNEEERRKFFQVREKYIMEKQKGEKLMHLRKNEDEFGKRNREKILKNRIQNIFSNSNLDQKFTKITKVSKNEFSSSQIQSQNQKMFEKNEFEKDKIDKNKIEKNQIEKVNSPELLKVNQMFDSFENEKIFNKDFVLEKMIPNSISIKEKNIFGHEIFLRQNQSQSQSQSQNKLENISNFHPITFSTVVKIHPESASFCLFAVNTEKDKNCFSFLYCGKDRGSNAGNFSIRKIFLQKNNERNVFELPVKSPAVNTDTWHSITLILHPDSTDMVENKLPNNPSDHSSSSIADDFSTTTIKADVALFVNGKMEFVLEKAETLPRGISLLADSEISIGSSPNLDWDFRIFETQNFSNFEIFENFFWGRALAAREIFLVQKFQKKIIFEISEQQSILRNLHGNDAKYYDESSTIEMSNLTSEPHFQTSQRSTETVMHPDLESGLELGLESNSHFQSTPHSFQFSTHTPYTQLDLESGLVTNLGSVSHSASVSNPNLIVDASYAQTLASGSVTEPYPASTSASTSAFASQGIGIIKSETEEEVYHRLVAIEDETKKNLIAEGKKYFIDESFPPSHLSLFIDPSKPLSKFKSVKKWLRAHEVVKGLAGDISPSLFAEKPVNPANVRQGRLGDCWFLSAVAVLSETSLIHNVIITNEYNEEGIYTVRFCIDGEWIAVVVDDWIPCNNKGRPVFARSRMESELWVMILEKAYAKLHGSYQALEGGLVQDALVDMTGGAGEEIDITTKEAKMNIACGRLWCQLIHFMQQKFLIGAGTPTGFEHYVTEEGIVEGHAYSVLRIVEIDGYRLLQLRNPWANEVQWKGDWSDESSLWTDRIKRKLNFKPQGDNGIFWMSWEDFQTRFRSIYVCRIYPSHMRTMIRSEWSGRTSAGCPNFEDWKNNPQFLLTILNSYSTHVFITLSQGGRKSNDLSNRGNVKSKNNESYFYIGFRVVKKGGKRCDSVIYTDEVVGGSDYVNTREVALELVLEPDSKGYTIIPTTFSPGEESAFILSVFTLPRVSLKSI